MVALVVKLPSIMAALNYDYRPRTDCEAMVKEIFDLGLAQRGVWIDFVMKPIGPVKKRNLSVWKQLIARGMSRSLTIRAHLV